MKRGEIRWYTFRLPDKRRPVLILTRNEVIDRLNEIIVVPVTRTIRGLTTEVVLTPDDGMPIVCTLNFDHVLNWLGKFPGPVLSSPFRRALFARIRQCSPNSFGIEIRAIRRRTWLLSPRLIEAACIDAIESEFINKP